MKHAAILIALLMAIALSNTSFTTKKSDDLLLPTYLKIIVIDGMGSYVEGATVTIYGNEEDFKKSENPVQEPQLTDKKGIVTFKNVEAKAYYVDVTKDKMSNYGAAQLTPELKEGRINKVNIVIE